jgi:uncharacterized membrane protein YvbJ
MTPEVCPNCGSEVPEGSRACPECGADETTGWSQGAYCERLGISDPDEAFDYGDFVKNEFGAHRQRGYGRRLIWTLTAVILLLALLVWAF